MLEQVASAVLTLLLRDLGSGNPAVVRAAVAVAEYVERLVESLGDPDAPDPGLVLAQDVELAADTLREQLLAELDHAAEVKRLATSAPPPYDEGE